jgi:hypothetical protein
LPLHHYLITGSRAMALSFAHKYFIIVVSERRSERREVVELIVFVSHTNLLAHSCSPVLY